MIFSARNPSLYKGIWCILVFLNCNCTLELLGKLLRNTDAQGPAPRDSDFTGLGEAVGIRVF